MARILTHPQNGTFSKDLWQKVIQRTQYLWQEADKLKGLLDQGWTTRDFFGCHKTHPLEQYACQGYVISSFHDKITGYKENSISTETYTKGKLTYTSIREHNEAGLISRFVNTSRLDESLYKHPTEHGKDLIVSYLKDHADQPAWQARTLSHMAKALNVDAAIVFGMINQLFEEQIIIHEYTGVYLLKKVD